MLHGECVNLILDKMEEIAKIARDFNPDCYHISMYVIGGTSYVTCIDEKTGEYLLNGRRERPEEGVEA